MLQEHKELLLKDLCARLPYGVKVKTPYNDAILRGIVDRKGVKTTIDYTDIVTDKQTYPIRYIKPYLRPMSSMTEEEEKEIQEIIGDPDNACIIRKTDGLELWLNFIDTDPTIWVDTIFEVQDYLNKNHFDYRGLIPMGLAIDATNLNIY